MRAIGKSQKQKILNQYSDLRKEAMNEIAVDMVRQTIAILLGSLRLQGTYTDDELRDMYNTFANIINLSEAFGKTICSDEFTDKVVKDLGIDLNKIQPKVGE